MPRLTYIDWKPNADTLAIIATADQIATSYAAQGYDLTLRQLYYQFIARALMPNTEQSYKRLGNIINQARQAGLIDWNHLTDRTRNLARNSHWTDPADIIDGAQSGYRLDLWSTQPIRVEIWVEKEALAGVIDRVATDLDCPWFACRGYVSQSEMWRAARRFIRYSREGQETVVLHLGDHDPSGIDMSRDIEDRLRLFGERSPIQVKRIALNMDQVEQYDPPPNPAKLTDSRATDYIENFGTESWELDALDPATLDALIRDQVALYLDTDLYQVEEARQEHDRELLQTVSNRWAELVTWLEENPE